MPSALYPNLNLPINSTDEANFLKFAGAALLGAIFLIGIFDFSRDLEINMQTHEFLKRTGCFEPDELVKLRYLLEALHYEGLAKIMTAPFRLAANRLRGLRGV